MKEYSIIIFNTFILFLSIYSILLLFNQSIENRGKGKIEKLSRGNHKEKINYHKEVDKNDNKEFFIFENGDKYKGELLEDKKNGYGICLFENGEKYVGYFKNDLMHFVGHYYYNDGSEYKGEFKDGKLDGYGTFSYSNKDFYKGYFKDNKKNGKGVFILNDGTRYSGYFKNNYYEGYGKLINISGEIYEGEFVNGKKQGKGTFVNSNYKFVGEFRQNKKNGIGIYYIGKDRIFEVEIKNYKVIKGIYKQKGKKEISIENIYINAIEQNINNIMKFVNKEAI